VSDRVLTQRQLNRALLARQLLLQRSSIELTEAVEQIGGLQTQYAPSAYIGLWSRLRDFRRETLTEALEQRRVVQATLMRATIHVVSAHDFPLLAAAIRQARSDWWVRVQGELLDDVDLDQLGRRVRAHLADGPLRQTVLSRRLEDDGFPRPATNGMGIVVDLVRVPPSGTWERRRADLYGLAETWLEPSDVSEQTGIEHAVRRYLGGYGPATLADVASWSGLPVSVLRPVVDRIELRRFRDEEGKLLLDLPDAPLPDPETAAPVRFLPTWDASLLVHARRTQLLPERYRPRIFSTRTPHSFPTFLVDGAVAGTWRHQDGRISLDPFEPLARRTMAELVDEADRLASFHA
jgi:hypothetical protein